MRLPRTLWVGVLYTALLGVLVVGCAKQAPEPSQPGATTPAAPSGKRDASAAKPSSAKTPPTAGKLGPGDKIKPAEPVALKAADGVALDAGWRPTAAKAKAGAVLVPMLGHAREDYDGFAQALAGYGVASLAVSLRGHGKSAAPGGKARDQFTTDDWKKAKQDIAAAVDQVRSKVDGAPVIIVGASIGANLAVAYAAEQPDKVKGLVLMSAGLDYHGVTLAEPFAKIKSKPMLVIGSADDSQAVPVAKLQTMHEGGKAFTMLQYDGSDHGTDLLSKHAQIVTKVTDWLTKLR